MKAYKNLKPINHPGEKLHEPFMPVKNGHGYLGVVLCDEATDKVQCHICGELFYSISQHISNLLRNGKDKLHADAVSSINDYKEKFGLNKGTPLQSPRLVRKASVRQEFLYRLHHENMTKEEITAWAKTMAEKSKKARAKRKKQRTKGWDRQRKTMMTAEMMNRFGTCPAQVEERFTKIVDKLGHTPSWDELYDKDPALMSTLCRRFKSYSNALQYFGLQSKRRVNKAEYELEDIENLTRKFIDEHKRLPNPKDTKIGYLPDYTTIRKRFNDDWMVYKAWAYEYLEQNYPMQADDYDQNFKRIRYER